MKNYGDQGGCNLTLEMSEMSAIFQVHNQNNSTSRPHVFLVDGALYNVQECCIFDVVFSLNTIQ